MSQKDERAQMGEAESGAAAARGPASVEPPPELGREIAKQLKVLYGRQMAEPLPEKFTALLDQLAKAERKV